LKVISVAPCSLKNFDKEALQLQKDTWPSRTVPVDFHATLCKGQQRQGTAEEQARIWLAELTGSEQAPTVSQLAAPDILLFVERQRLQPHQWNIQIHCPATTAHNSCCC
jgi:hypothetical protein